MRQMAVILAVVVLLAGVYLGVRAGDTAQAKPVIFAPSDVQAPVLLAGTAVFDGEPVRVELRVDGEVVQFDEIMEGTENNFEFQIPESYRGRDVQIVAIGPGGVVTHHPVIVN